MPTTRTRRQLNKELSVNPSDVNSRSSPREQTAGIASSKGEKGLETEDGSPETKRARKTRSAANVEEDKRPLEAVDDAVSPPNPKRRKLSLPKEEDVPVKSHKSPSPDVSDDQTITAKETAEVSEEALRVNSEDCVKTEPEDPPHSVAKTRKDNLSNLASLSDQVLTALASLTYLEALQLQHDQTSAGARQFKQIRSLFDPIRQLYSTPTPFLSPEELGLTDPAQIEILRKANQATYLSSVFTGEIGLRDMDQNFLNVFIPPDGHLSEAQGSIYIELKTQAFITAWRTGAPLMPVVEELFPSDMQEKIVKSRTGSELPLASEKSFLERLATRRDVLLAHTSSGTLNQLQTVFTYLDLGREVSAYLAHTFGPLAKRTADNPATNPPESRNSSFLSLTKQTQNQSSQSISTTGLGHSANSNTSTIAQSFGSTPIPNNDDLVAQMAQRATEIAMQGYYADLAARQGAPLALESNVLANQAEQSVQSTATRGLSTDLASATATTQTAIEDVVPNSAQEEQV